MFLAWSGLLGLVLLAGRGEGQGCLPGIQDLVPNLAQGRPAFQCSDYAPDLAAEKAVDGTCLGDVVRYRSCSHTHGDTDPWWYVDLEEKYAVSTVVVKNRRDCCWDRLQGTEIRVGDSLVGNGKFNTLCGTIQDTSPGSLNVINCHGFKGRYVSANVHGRAEYLTLCEVEVYGKKV